MIMSRLKYILGLVILLSFVRANIAQTYVASATIDSTEILIGDQVNFQWQITSPKENSIILPAFNDTIIEKVEIVRKGKLDSLINGSELTLKQSMLITSFDSGYYRIPPFDFKVLSGEDTLSVTTNELFLYVTKPDVDTTQAIKDIKGPISEPITIKELLPWFIGGVGLVAIIIAAIYIIRRLKKSKPVLMKPKPKIPPHITALEELERLKHKKLWQSSLEKQYHSELTEIVRTYIEGRFGINAMEMTSDEILEAMQRTMVAYESKHKLHQMLTLADLVKFAKAHPLPTEHDMSMKNALDFVNETMQIVRSDTVSGVSDEESNLPEVNFENTSEEETK